MTRVLDILHEARREDTVVGAVLPDGRKIKITGHTRASRGQQLPAVTPAEVRVITIPVRDEDEAARLYNEFEHLLGADMASTMPSCRRQIFRTAELDVTTIERVSRDQSSRRCSAGGRKSALRFRHRFAGEPELTEFTWHRDAVAYAVSPHAALRDECNSPADAGR
jgi:hypothetical protein